MGYMIPIRTTINADGGLLLLSHILVIEVGMAGERRGGGGRANTIDMAILNARRDMGTMGIGMEVAMVALSMDINGTPNKHNLSTSIHMLPMAKLKHTIRTLSLLLAPEDEAGQVA